MRWYREHANGWISEIEEDVADRWLVYAYPSYQDQALTPAQLNVRGESDAKARADGFVQAAAPHSCAACGRWQSDG